ncbi:MAG: hypothetical protein JWP44_5102 [Mucilaginibacter sp.]|nr:hypothetical protein [Mucilaginibacter sp.]
MNGYIDTLGNYYEGDRQGNDLVVPQRPDYTYTWSGNAWVPPAGPALAELIAQKKADIQTYRDQLCLTTPYNGKVFQTDLNSKIQISVIVFSGTVPDTASQWRTADNSYMPMTLTDYQGLMAAITAREGAAFANSFVLQDAVSKLTTVKKVQAFDITTGWPT